MISRVIHDAVSSVTGQAFKSCDIADAPSKNNQPGLRSIVPAVTAGSQEPPITLLLVDDEPTLLDVGKLWLERSTEITVVTSGSAEQSLNLMKTVAFDAIVSDYQMPGLDGIAFLQIIRKKSRTLPFILFTGKGREDVVIEALNSGADYYLQKGGDPKSQYAELAHKVKRAVSQRRAESALKRKHAVLRAILSASPYGIGYVRNRTFQWVNDSLAGMLGYRRADLKGLHLSALYENRQTYEEIGRRIQQDLRAHAKARIITRFRHSKGFSIDTEIHIAPLDSGNLHFGHMILMADISKKVTAIREVRTTGIPHLELTPVIEVDESGRITYYNDAALDAMVKYGSRGSLEEFFPEDLDQILTRMDAKDTGSIFREVCLGTTMYRVHVTLSAKFRVARLSAVAASGA